MKYRKGKTEEKRREEEKDRKEGRKQEKKKEKGHKTNYLYTVFLPLLVLCN